MKSYIFALLSVFVASVSATYYSHSSTFYGCPGECETEKGPKCENGIPKDRHFVALHKKYFPDGKDSKYCDNYWVGMVLDEKANGDYKMLRGKVVDQCGSCDETQVDLSSQMFEKLAHHDTGVLQMMFVLINKDTNEFMTNPIYSDSTLSKFSQRHGISKDAVVSSFKEAAKHLNRERINGMHDFPWKNGISHGSSEKKITRKTTVQRTTTVHTHAHTTHAHTHKTIAKVTTTKKIEIPVVTPKVPVVPKPVVSQAQGNSTDETPVDTPVAAPVVAPVVQKPVAEKPVAEKPIVQKPVEKQAEKPVAQKPLEENENGSNPLAAGVVGFGVVGAAGVGLMMLKRQSPQKYDDLKQKFPEAFGNLKRSVSRGASTIKRGVSRSVSRRGNTQVNTPPLPASYSFTLSNEDGLPRVALYDDPYPTKTHGAQHW